MHHLQALYTQREVGFTNVASSHRPLDIFPKLFWVITENNCCIMVQGILIIRLLQHDIWHNSNNKHFRWPGLFSVARSWPPKIMVIFSGLQLSPKIALFSTSTQPSKTIVILAANLRPPKINVLKSFYPFLCAQPRAPGFVERAPLSLSSLTRPWARRRRRLY